MKVFLRQQTLFELLSVIIASLLLTTYFLELWNVDWRIPFQYSGGDAFQSHAVFKSIIDTGTYLENPFLGAPGKLEYYDFPRTDHIQVIIARDSFLVLVGFRFKHKHLFRPYISINGCNCLSGSSVFRNFIFISIRL